MRKKLLATLAVAIFLLSAFAVVVPAQAHFTLGNLSGASPYAVNNFDPHVAGPIGYVWPGSGENAYAGSPNIASDNLSPGYQSPYPAGNPPGAPDNSWYQLQGDTYSPFGAVLTNSTGDLIFGLNATCTPDLWSGNPGPVSSGGNGCATQFDPNGNGVTKSEFQSVGLSASTVWTTWIILIPPEFTVPGATAHDASWIASTVTNSYDHYLVAKLGPDDRYAPGWTVVAVTADGTADYNSAGKPYYQHQYIQFTKAGEWYYVRINGVTAPSTAGRYFFKMGLYSGSDVYGVGPSLPGSNEQAAFSSTTVGKSPFVWVPPQNWPVLLVKGEVDPAIMTGILRYGGYNATLYTQPIGEAAYVQAKMTERINPYNGQQDPTLPLINAQAYVNATANGHYEVEGLAAGIYDLYASAAGYPTQLCERGVTVLRGQSLHFDCYLQPGPVIHGNVYTKHQFGDEPWPGNSTTGQYIKIELYANPTLTNIVDPSAGPPVSWTPLPCVAGGQEYYQGEFAAGSCGDPRDGSAISFPWHEYSTVNAADYHDPPNLFTGLTNGYTRDASIGPCDVSYCTGIPWTGFPTGSRGSTLGVDALLASDPEGVGPPQHWFVPGGTTTPFHFEMGLKGEYGAPTNLSGEVPQVFATWVNGLTPGRYYVRAWTFRYVQTSLDGATFQEYYFDITPNEWAGDVTLPIDLRLSSWVNKTVYFHDTSNTIRTNPIATGAGYMWGYLTGADGHVYAANVTGLGLLESGGVGSSAGTPNYYYSTDGNTENTKFENACFSYDQWSYAQHAMNGNFFATGESGAPSRPCRFGSGPGQEVSALDKAGLNANSIATGIATIQYWGINDTWSGENYGIPSGTYTPQVGVNGYVSLTPPEQVSVTLSGSPTSISDHLHLAPGFNLSVYSIDWERPSVARNWVWSGCQRSWFFWVGADSADNSPLCAGSEIDVGWYPQVNGTASALTDYFGFEPSFLPLTISPEFRHDFGGLFQGPAGTDCVTGIQPAFACALMDGGGRDVLPGYHYSNSYFGQSAEFAFVGGYTAGLLGLTIASQLRTDAMFTTPVLVWPLHFTPGEYDLAAYTYGYIQDQPYTAYAMNGQVADMRINLILGVNVTLDILFKKESIITPTPYNMSARVRLFNDQSQLVAEWMSSEGTYVDRTGHAVAANGQLPATASGLCPGTNTVGLNCFPLYPFNDLHTTTSSQLNGYNFLPGGVNLLHVTMAGLPQQPPFGSILTGTYFGDPIATGVPLAKALGPSAAFDDEDFTLGAAPYGSCDFQLNCYPAVYVQYPFPYTGIAGAPDYTGGWTAEVDFVPWYTNNTSSAQTNCQANFRFRLTFCWGPGNYYPPVNGLLMGESYHIVPGTTATSGISLTEDMATGPYFIGHSLAANHLGPYSQQGVWQIAGAHNSGEASAIFEVDLNGFISGQMLGFTWANEFRTQSWDTISVTGASGATLPAMYTFDGLYQGFFAPGQYSFTINAPGYTPQTWSISITPGESGTGQNVYLQQSQIPVPEFSAVAVMAFSALAASVYLLRRRRR